MKTVKQVASASGVSVRALHHYDHIGLLAPEIGENGYRYYGRVEILRLQQILFYRELGVSLSEIARILDDPTFDTRSALIDLRKRVETEIERRRDLARTIDRTLSLIDAGKPLNERALFDGVSSARQAAWEAELAERFGEPAESAIREANAAIASLSSNAFLDFKAEIDAIHKAFVDLIEAGGMPASRAAQTLTERHYLWVCRSWRPDAKAYVALGRLYSDHSDFRSIYDALHPRLCSFLAEAMATYARIKLKGSPQ
jgi:DNA-binding transcriptional MerR regulator